MASSTLRIPPISDILIPDDLVAAVRHCDAAGQAVQDWTPDAPDTRAQRWDAALQAGARVRQLLAPLEVAHGSAAVTAALDQRLADTRR